MKHRDVDIPPLIEMISKHDKKEFTTYLLSNIFKTQYRLDVKKIACNIIFIKNN